MRKNASEINKEKAEYSQLMKQMQEAIINGDNEDCLV